MTIVLTDEFTHVMSNLTYAFNFSKDVVTGTLEIGNFMS